MYFLAYSYVCGLGKHIDTHEYHMYCKHDNNKQKIYVFYDTDTYYFLSISYCFKSYKNLTATIIYIFLMNCFHYLVPIVKHHVAKDEGYAFYLGID